MLYCCKAAGLSRDWIWAYLLGCRLPGTAESLAWWSARRITCTRRVFMNSLVVVTEQGSNAKGLSNPCYCSWQRQDFFRFFYRYKVIVLIIFFPVAYCCFLFVIVPSSCLQLWIFFLINFRAKPDSVFTVADCSSMSLRENVKLTVN